MDIKNIRKGKIVRLKNGSYQKVKQINECNSMFYIRYENYLNSDFYKKDGSSCSDLNKNIVKII